MSAASISLPSRLQLVDVDADDAERAAADVDLAVGDGRRAFEVDELPGGGAVCHSGGPCRAQAVQDGAVGLVHAVAEDERLPSTTAGELTVGSFRIGRGLGPQDALGGLGIGRQAAGTWRR